MAWQIRGVSIVVIAHNEETSLPRCLDSLTRFDMLDCEVICVDSLSTDNTRNIMMIYKDQYSNFVVLSPPECRNAAMARNHGMNIATKSIIYFVDGDIELNPEFMLAALEELKSPDVFAMTGGLDEIIYDDSSGVPLSKRYSRISYKERGLVVSCGGMFLARMTAIRATGLYDERFYINEDIDYSLRLTNKYPMIALPLQVGIHHTREHRNRPWLRIAKGHILNQGMLARKHFRRPGFWKYWYGSRKSFVWGFIVFNVFLLLAVLHLYSMIPSWWLSLFATIFIAFEVTYSILKKQSLISTLINHILSPYAIFFGFVAEPLIKKSERRT